MTHGMLEEIRFYNKFKPYSLFSDEVFGNGCGVEGEHLININIDITSNHTTFKDSFEWDIVNPDNM
jgi:hypothetical protein